MENSKEQMGGAELQTAVDVCMVAYSLLQKERMVLEVAVARAAAELGVVLTPEQDDRVVLSLYHIATQGGGDVEAAARAELVLPHGSKH